MLQFVVLTRRTAYHPTPPSFLFNNFQIPPSQPSIRIPFIFITIQIPFCANSLFSNRSKTPGGDHRSLNFVSPFTSYQLARRSLGEGGSQTTSHVFSRSCRLFGLSLQRFYPSFPLFSAAYRYFFADTGGATPRAVPVVLIGFLSLATRHFFFVVSFCSTSGHFCMEER